MSNVHNTMCSQRGLRMEVIASLRKNGAALFATGIWEAFYQSAMVVRGRSKSPDVLCVT